MIHPLFKVLFISVILVSGLEGYSDDLHPEFEFKKSDGKIEILSGDHHLAVYEYQNQKTTRPFFAHVQTLGGIQVTRSFPPGPEESQDHQYLHPGIFLAFGDLDGNDYWRLKSAVKNNGVDLNAGDNSFTVKNQYLTEDGNSLVCEETCHYLFLMESDGYVIECSSTFENREKDFYFGDQEEMGLGIRVASFIREKGGNGRILNSNELLSASQTWGKGAAWCDYTGTVQDSKAGIMLMASPRNLRPTWWHNRDYGVFVANMFGRKAMQQGEESRLVVRKGESFQLNYAVYVHESPEISFKDLSQVYQNYSEREQKD